VGGAFAELEQFEDELAKELATDTCSWNHLTFCTMLVGEFVFAANYVFFLVVEWAFRRHVEIVFSSKPMLQWVVRSLSWNTLDILHVS
jgi:hypothetical protein